MNLTISHDGDVRTVERVEYFEVRDGYVYVERDGIRKEFAGQLGAGSHHE